MTDNGEGVFAQQRPPPEPALPPTPQAGPSGLQQPPSAPQNRLEARLATVRSQRMSRPIITVKEFGDIVASGVGTKDGDPNEAGPSPAAGVAPAPAPEVQVEQYNNRRMTVTLTKEQVKAVMEGTNTETTSTSSQSQTKSLVTSEEIDVGLLDTRYESSARIAACSMFLIGAGLLVVGIVVGLVQKQLDDITAWLLVAVGIALLVGAPLLVLIQYNCLRGQRVREEYEGVDDDDDENNGSKWAH